MELPKIHSITKKILVALLGGFLLLFLLFHATANLFILRHDDGAWYSAFCHFMGTNWLVKIFEIILLGVIALHILLTLWLAFTNRLARPVRYHQSQRSTTHTTSKLMVWTGILIFVCLILHFSDFYFVKLGWVKGEYMVKTEKLQNEEIMGLVNFAQQMQVTPEDLVNELENNALQYSEANDDEAEVKNYIASMREKLEVINIVQRASEAPDPAQGAARKRSRARLLLHGPQQVPEPLHCGDVPALLRCGLLPPAPCLPVCLPNTRIEQLQIQWHYRGAGQNLYLARLPDVRCSADTRIPWSIIPYALTH